MTAAAALSARVQDMAAPFRLLRRHPNFGLLWSGQVVSHLGEGFYSIALIWLVQELTGSRAMMGAISAVISATALSSLVSGALVDRWNARQTMLGSDILRALIISLLPLLAWLDQLQVWHIFVVAAAMGVVGQFFYPAKQTLIPQLVGLERLTEANALSHMAYMLLMAAGYGLGGLLLSRFAPSELCTITVITFLISALAIWRVQAPAGHGAGAQSGEAGPQAQSGFKRLWADIIEGLRYLGQDKLIATVVPVSLLANFIYAPLGVLLAAWAKDVLHAGASGFGLLEGAMLVGSVVGTMLVSMLTAVWSRGRLVTAGVALMGLPLILFALLPNLAVNAALLGGIGLVNSVINIVLITVMQQRVPPGMMGRLFGLLTGFGMLAAPLGAGLGGWLADQLPLAVMFAVMGSAMTLIGLSLLGRKAILQLM